MGTLSTLNGQPQEPKMGAFWGLKLLPMPNVTFSGYGFVPLLPGTRTATLCGKNSLELGSCNAWVRNGFLEARSSSLRKLAMAEGHLIITEFRPMR
jgi:hypothetical protein